ncbi:retron system putative HNH endonuclease [Kamptonema sp. UHCC 0994]|uniref:retron system putative HNH endonuclease n=1 Tax=Kamptonema sp. UHCC 0994 TaxID=3031329 RepID=UPI0023B8D909|nr:retron system putative HNH endonuclease [Kamptonema sp. UHCC 0994]MDF0554117.1 TIGR02646 family protein [Kamptonema sp. UHCC 0994]
MKYIKKRVEPKDFGHWKAKAKTGKNYGYSLLNDPTKGILHDSLMQEQGYICCYCCQRIASKTSHIEHLNPQNPENKSDSNTDLSLDYNNMLASCGSDKHWPKHCGNKKGNQPINISPTQTNCEDFFSYTGNGEMRSPINNNLEQAEAAKKTIEILGLNDYNLQQSRIQALDFLKLQLQGLTPTQISRKAQQIRDLDAQGQYLPFWSAVSYYLKKYYGI